LGRKFATLFVALGMLAVLGGAQCREALNPMRARPPQVLTESPTLAEVMSTVNHNSGLVRTLYTNNASVSVPLMPALKADLAFDRPRRFVLRGKLLSSPQFEVGSNDELFWMWTRQANPPTLFYCRHDQFASSQARSVLPIEPEWLIDALGVPSFDPAVQHRGPFPVGAGRLRIETPSAGASGEVAKVTVVDARSGWVVEQHWYDHGGQRLGSAVASGHQIDAYSGAVLPGHVTIESPPTQMTLNIDLRDLRVNQLSGDPASLWTMPPYEDSRHVNLAAPGGQLPYPVHTPPAAIPQAASPWGPHREQTSSF